MWITCDRGTTSCNDKDNQAHVWRKEELKASGCGKLKSIQMSKQLTELRELDVSGCSELEALRGVDLEALPGVKHMRWT